MDTVAFINATMAGKKRDLILSFAIADEQWLAGIRSLILLRSPAYEWVFDESERGVTVSMEGQDDGSNVADQLLVEFAYDPSAKTVCVKTRKHTYDLDVRKADAEELTQMHEILKKMNFDSRVKVL